MLFLRDIPDAFITIFTAMVTKSGLDNVHCITDTRKYIFSLRTSINNKNIKLMLEHWFVTQDLEMSEVISDAV